MLTRGFSFVEVLIATAILAVAFVPIAGLIQQSFSQVSGQRMEAAAASYAAKVVNEWMFEKDYDTIDCTNTTIPEEDIGDGIFVRVDVSVWEVDPPGSPPTGITGNDMTFEYYRIRYHSPCADGRETNNYDTSIDPEDLRNLDRGVAAPYTGTIDSKYQGSDATPPMKTLYFTFQWRGRWEEWPAVGTREERLRTRYIICRRANLE